MQEELQQAVETGKLTQSEAEVIGQLAPGGFCSHRSWGFGKVASWDLGAGRVIIDFDSKAGHAMQVAYAAETLTPIPPDHILALVATVPDEVRAQAKSDPLSLVRGILESFGGRATVEVIGNSLVPGIFPSVASFKKWWDGAKKLMKADGCFQLPARKNDPVVLLAEPRNHSEGLLNKFRSAKHLKEQVAAIDLITKALDDFANEVEEMKSLAAQIEDAAAKGSRLQSAQALELLLARDEILSHHEALQQGESAPSAADILIEEQGNLQALLDAIPASKQRRVLELFPKAFGEEWVDRMLGLMASAPTRLVVEISKFLQRAEKIDELRAFVTRSISDRSVTTDALIWLAKERGGPFPEVFNLDLLNAIFSSLERDMLDEKRGSRLQDLLLKDQALVGEFLEGVPPDAVRDTMRRLLLTPVFDELDKRSLLGRIIKMYPEVQSMMKGAEESDEDLSLTVSWPSLEARKAAYEFLVTVEIPQNTKDIAVAREQGDLRENFGFKAAKEQQRVLARRQQEAELELKRARGTDFERPDTTQVSIGTVVKLAGTGGEQETYSILGAWDSAPHLGIVSYKAGIGQALLGKKQGESVELMGDKGTRQLTILSIEPFTDLDLLKEINPMPRRQREQVPATEGEF